MRKRILIIGGTGIFGQKLCHHLATHFDLDLFISSRSENNAINFVHKLKRRYPDKSFDYVALDTSKNLNQVLLQLTPDITVDCSGPFQFADYEIAKAALKSGSHYVDMADAPEYLSSFNDALHDLATQNDVACITGASSSPCFTVTAAKHLVSDWQRIDDMNIAFIPGGKGDVGPTVIQAILSYAGQPISTWREGKLDQTAGWANSKSMQIGALGWRQTAPAETYDAEYLGDALSVKSTVSFSAGLESPIEHYGVVLMAKLSKWGLPLGHKSIARPFSRPLHKIRFAIKPFVTGRGGMMVRASGLNADGIYQSSEYELLVEQNQGPNIPILPTAAVIRKLLTEINPTGAAFAFDTVDVADIEAECAPYPIYTQVLNDYPSTGIYQRYLGAEKYQELPASLREFHKIDGYPVWCGTADISSGNSLAARIVSKIVGFPASGKDVPVTVSVQRGINQHNVMSEIWTRNFAGKRFSSELSIDKSGTFREQFGNLSFEIGLDVVDGAIVMPIKSWKIKTPLGALPMPLGLAPISQTREFADENGVFNFDVEVNLPLFGLLAHYRGKIKPAD